MVQNGAKKYHTHVNIYEKQLIFSSKFLLNFRLYSDLQHSCNIYQHLTAKFSVSGPSALSWRQVFYKAMEFDGDADPMENEVEGICIIPIHLYIEDIEVECFFIHFINFIHFIHLLIV